MSPVVAVDDQGRIHALLVWDDSARVAFDKMRGSRELVPGDRLPPLGQ